MVASARVGWTTSIPRLESPIQSPSAIGPAGLSLARTALVTSPATTRWAAEDITPALVSTLASGSYSSRAAKPSATPTVFTTRTRLPVRASTCSATGTMLPLFGSTTTSSAGAASTASRICAVDGFMDWPPATIWWTPSDRKMRRMPVPVATATTAVAGTGQADSSSAGGPAAASRTQRSSCTWSIRSVTRMFRGLPQSMPASTAAPMSSV